MHTVYSNDSGDLIYRRYDNGLSSWSSPVVLESGSVVGNPGLGINPANEMLFAFWFDGIDVVYKRGDAPYDVVNWDLSKSSLGAATAVQGLNSELSSDATRLLVTWTEGLASPFDVNTAQVSINIIPSPEINITGNSQSIADGDTTPSVDDDTEYGNVTASSGSVTKSYHIENVGPADLLLTGSPFVQISGANAGDFNVILQPSSSTIISSGSSEFQVTFDPTATGIREAMIVVGSNDADENPYSFSISGTGLADMIPEINIQGNSIDISSGDNSPSVTDFTDFSSTPISGGMITRLFTIENLGDATLSLTGPNPVSITGSAAADFRSDHES